MKIGLIGFGRMGKATEQIAQQLGHEICCVFELENPLSESSELNGAEVLIDFSLGSGVDRHLQLAASHALPIVEGTTGWQVDPKRLNDIPGLTLIYSPNFSIGMYQFLKIIEYAGKLFGEMAEYDCYIHEWHHRGKADSPSGTAKKMAAILLKNLTFKDTSLFTSCEHKIDPKALHVTSTRVGRIPGYHEIGFDSDFDFIKLKHEAHGRKGFAYGAVRAAEWVIGKKGIYTMDDFMENVSKR